MTDGSATTGGFAFQGRTAVEYEQFFDLDPENWDSILDCGAGPSSFAATVYNQTDIVAVDPAYSAPVSKLRGRTEASVDGLAAALPDLEERFVWQFYESPDERLAYLEQAHRQFLDDFTSASGRYVAARLPKLPFRADSFELVLTAHLLFMYDNQLSETFHRRAIAELCRIAQKEVRVYPLVSLDGEPSDHVATIVEWLEEDGRDTERRTVPFEFQRDADEMLVVLPD